jgi:hypothetical protein
MEEILQRIVSEMPTAAILLYVVSSLNQRIDVLLELIRDLSMSVKAAQRAERERALTD